MRVGIGVVVNSEFIASGSRKCNLSKLELHEIVEYTVKFAVLHHEEDSGYQVSVAFRNLNFEYLFSGS